VRQAGLPARPDGGRAEASAVRTERRRPGCATLCGQGISERCQVVETVERRLLLQRLSAAGLVAVLVPLLVGIGSVADEQPISEGEPSPRTVIAEEQVRVEDEEATETERAQAAESVAPITSPDRTAQTAIVQDARTAFSTARSVRQPGSDDADDEDAAPAVPSRTEQIDAILAAVPALDQEVAAALVDLADEDLEPVERETIGVVTQLARQPVTPTSSRTWSPASSRRRSRSAPSPGTPPRPSPSRSPAR
jgi:membrane-associated HD superfamily phosphohydrolase